PSLPCVWLRSGAGRVFENAPCRALGDRETGQQSLRAPRSGRCCRPAWHAQERATGSQALLPWASAGPAPPGSTTGPWVIVVRGGLRCSSSARAAASKLARGRLGQALPWRCRTPPRCVAPSPAIASSQFEELAWLVAGRGCARMLRFQEATARDLERPPS